MERTIPKEVDEYLKKGRRKIKEVLPNEDFTLTVTFDNGEIKIYDVRPNLRGIMEPFNDIKRFKSVYLDEDGAVCWDIDPQKDSKINWNNKIDLCPDSIYIYSVPINKYRK